MAQESLSSLPLVEQLSGHAQKRFRGAKFKTIFFGIFFENVHVTMPDISGYIRERVKECGNDSLN